MDHISTPPNPVYRLPKVPFLGAKYNGWNFTYYPEQKGWVKQSSFGHSQLVRHNGYLPAQLGQFAQEWLYFGFLTELLRIYDIEVDIEKDFLRRDSDQTFVTTINLESYIERMMARDRNAPPQERLQRVIQSTFIFDTARKFARSLVGEREINASVPTEVGLSIAILGATFQGAVQYLAKDVMPDGLLFDKMHPDLAVAFIAFEVMPTAFIRERLVEAKWCKSEIRRLQVFLDVRNLLYASMMNRGEKKLDHEKCTEEACLAYTIHEETYESKHVKDGCSCLHIGVNTHAVAGIYEKRGIPIAKICPISDGTSVYVEIVDAEVTKEPYLAISHVWADGLGNPKRNTLPECQLKRLLEMMKNLPEDLRSLPIWMDTLCIPVKGAARKLAIAAMADIYRGAESVVVLDAELQQIPIAASSNEQMLRIGISPWAKRVWTLQEAVFAKDLYFKLKDGFANVGSLQLMEEIRVMFNPHLQRLSQRIRELFDDRVPSDFSQFGPKATDRSDHPIVRWSLSLMFRSTSKRIDESVCLASLAELDVARLLKYDTLDERMRELFCMIDKIPAPTLFLNETDRVELDGFRWAPRSLLNMSSSLGATLTRGEKLTQIARLDSQYRGLIVSFPGFMLKIHDGLSLQEDLSVARFYAWLDREDEESILIKFQEEEHRNRFVLLETVALVTETPLSDKAQGFLGTVSPDTEDGNTVYISYLFPVYVSTRSEISNAARGILGRAEASLDGDPFPHVGVCIAELSEYQSWCVG